MVGTGTEAKRKKAMEDGMMRKVDGRSREADETALLNRNEAEGSDEPGFVSDHQQNWIAQWPSNLSLD